jgi:hypothetical protein
MYSLSLPALATKLNTVPFGGFDLCGLAGYIPNLVGISVFKLEAGVFPAATLFQSRNNNWLFR